ncbi:unnamed protein product [Ectocarpus sp. CCAP 1310/34]|nr:unnamed protein product [Ectocarpus sp. CCAP 1310/34]
MPLVVSILDVWTFDLCRECDRDRLRLLLKEQGDVNLDDVKKYDDEDDADSGDDLDISDSDDDSDDDEEALEKELEKIRKEREEARKKKPIS